MAFWNRGAGKPAASPPPPLPEIEQLAELIPERDRDEDFLWQPYVARITWRFDGLPAPDDGGARQGSTLWEKNLSGREWHERFESDLARRVRLGLFFAARPGTRRSPCAAWPSPTRSPSGIEMAGSPSSTWRP